MNIFCGTYYFGGHFYAFWGILSPMYRMRLYKKRLEGVRGVAKISNIFRIS